ncbi:dihydrofolate reductase family protein [Thermoflavifilum thermophilum]|nr:dihydrofolate reductase family protein [Thermoflavifilum thermophilum]
MRKLKLQVQLSVDGFVGGPQGEMDWLEWNWDENIKQYVLDLTRPVDTIVLGRKLAEGFIPAWQSRLSDPHTADDFARKMVETPKVIFTRTLDQSVWENAVLAKGDLITEITRLKHQKGGDIIAYGGATFVSSLLRAGLIDEYFLFVNPVAIGKGLSIFHELDRKLNFRLIEAQPFDCGIVVLHYVVR